MDPIAVPNTFSNLPHQHACKGKRDSLFFIKMVPVPAYFAQMREDLKTKGMSDEKITELLNGCEMATGFVMSEDDHTYEILTCAHLFEHFYSAEFDISLDQLNSWFDVLVVCSHYEEYMANHYLNWYSNPNHDFRMYTPATVVRFNHNKDLMLLAISKDELYTTNTMVRCQMPHRRLRLARNLSQPMEDVIMISWPPCRNDTPVIGQMVSPTKVYGQITRDLSMGYNMHLIELDITGDAGSSGAPILNHCGSVLGAFHGRLNSMGYGISVNDIREFLLAAELACQDSRETSVPSSNSQTSMACSSSCFDMDSGNFPMAYRNPPVSPPRHDYLADYAEYVPWSQGRML
ncbi:hypothetical protein ACP70R_026077 [Stipagrostis hirtigluma subsp. patula]